MVEAETPAVQVAGTIMKQTWKMNNGIEIPIVGYGCYQVETSDPFYWSIKHGYRHLDSATYYKNEAMIGKEVKRAYVDFGIKRSDLFITTKVPPWLQGYELAKQCVEDSLKNFDLEYLDLVLIHHPGTEDMDPQDPRNRENRNGTWKALEEFVDQGLVKSIGVSNYQARHIEELWELARIKPVINQFELHPMYIETTTIEACKSHKILVEAYSPFAQWNEKLVENEVVVAVAKRHGIDVARAILLHLLAKGYIVLPKSATEARLANNLLLEGIKLSEEDIRQMDELAKENFKIEWTSDEVL